jgi:hypothetical protein
MHNFTKKINCSYNSNICSPRNNTLVLAVLLTGFRYSNYIIHKLVVLTCAIKFLKEYVEFGMYHLLPLCIKICCLLINFKFSQINMHKVLFRLIQLNSKQFILSYRSYRQPKTTLLYARPSDFRILFLLVSCSAVNPMSNISANCQCRSLS